MKLDVRPASFLRLYGSFTGHLPLRRPGAPGRHRDRLQPRARGRAVPGLHPGGAAVLPGGQAGNHLGPGPPVQSRQFPAHSAIDGISIKGFLPLGPNGLTLVGLGEGSAGTGRSRLHDDLAELIAAAGLFETSLSRLTFGLSAYYRIDPGLQDRGVPENPDRRCGRGPGRSAGMGPGPDRPGLRGGPGQPVLGRRPPQMAADPGIPVRHFGSGLPGPQHGPGHPGRQLASRRLETRPALGAQLRRRLRAACSWGWKARSRRTCG